MFYGGWKRGLQKAQQRYQKVLQMCCLLRISVFKCGPCGHIGICILLPHEKCPCGLHMRVHAENGFNNIQNPLPNPKIKKKYIYKERIILSPQTRIQNPLSESWTCPVKWSSLPSFFYRRPVLWKFSFEIVGLNEVQTRQPAGLAAGALGWLGPCKQSRTNYWVYIGSISKSH